MGSGNPCNACSIQSIDPLVLISSIKFVQSDPQSWHTFNNSGHVE